MTTYATLNPLLRVVLTADHGSVMDVTEESYSEALCSGRKRTVAGVRQLLGGEMSAVASYVRAINQCPDEDVALMTANLDSHQDRLALLQQRLLALDGTSVSHAEAWSALACAPHARQFRYDQHALHAILAHGEDVLLDDYLDAVDSFDLGTSDFVLRHLLPCQERTHQALSGLFHDSLTASVSATSY